MSDTKEPASQEPGSKSGDEGTPPQTVPPKSTEDPLARELISAPIAKQQSDPKTGEDIEKLRRDYHDLRDRLNNIRENDILALKDKSKELYWKFYGAALLVGLLGLFGVKLYFYDLNKMIEDSVRERSDKAISFNEKFIRATTLAGVDDHHNAIRIFSELYDQNPEDEILFYRLLDCLNRAQRYKDAMPYIKRARKSGFLEGKYRNLFSYNNAGYFVLIESAEDPSLRPEAYELLRKAEEIGDRAGDNGIRYPLSNLALYHVLAGEPQVARTYGLRCRRFEGDNWEWSPWEESLLNRLKKARPFIVKEMKDAFAKEQR